VLAALAGANLIYGSGMIESGVTIDYAQLVLDNEIARMVKQVVGGIAVNDDTLLVDDIHRVGAFGDFLSLPSTYAHMREQSQPRVMDRRVREDWEADGAPDARTRARAQAREILEGHAPTPLPDDAAKQISAIVAAADRELAGV
jgi:trimethylamine---corrinoid protein Co-methyltransferase